MDITTKAKVITTSDATTGAIKTTKDITTSDITTHDITTVASTSFQSSSTKDITTHDVTIQGISTLGATSESPLTKGVTTGYEHTSTSTHSGHYHSSNNSKSFTEKYLIYFVSGGSGIFLLLVTITSNYSMKYCNLQFNFSIVVTMVKLSYKSRIGYIEISHLEFGTLNFEDAGRFTKIATQDIIIEKEIGRGNYGEVNKLVLFL